ncbi:glycosyltransferase [Microvirga tunisiensis]|uniref:Glycosyltransferase n=2 Tax=Pannonibacter tanglangensis TaxID=2750084 RepID=A0A7X5J9Y4_9HYPH|nr:glycosyltransferase [Pannonibacter sp. XCT-53]
MRVLVSRGFPVSLVDWGYRMQAYHGGCPADHLLQQTIITPDTYYSAVAEAAGVPFLPAGAFRPLVIGDLVLQFGDGEAGPLLIGIEEGKPVYVVAPDLEAVPDFIALLDRHPAFRASIRVTTPAAMRVALTVLRAPAGELEQRFPEMSARERVSPGQYSALSMLSLGFGCGLMLPLELQAFVFSLLVGLSCISTGLGRVASALHTAIPPLRDRIDPDLDDRAGHLALAGRSEDWPAYTVLVPLYREAAVVPGLVAALAGLDYPRDRLDIKFLVECDDHDTKAAFSGLLHSGMEVVVVPDGRPRTKPRALAYGLAAAQGEFVTIYDAEDRPEPDQLKKAVRRFRDSPESLACLQASLSIDNATDSFFTRQFAMEYAVLFDQMIPWFTSEGWAFPLGGTSNHFRRSALIACGGWDPYNVTEDADLGIRLARFGYDSAALNSTTFEEAPVTWKAWYAQRARWYKGWLQTCFVHLRDPRLFLRQSGLARTLPMSLLIGGSLVTLAVHPLFTLAMVGYVCGLWGLPPTEGIAAQMVVILSSLTFLVGYGATAFAGVTAAARRGIPLRLVDVVGIPVYWLCASLAFYRAVWDFVLRPHHWHKTTHGTARQRSLPGRRDLT